MTGHSRTRAPNQAHHGQRGLMGGGQGEGEAAAAVWRTLEGKRAAVELGDLAAEVEAEAEALDGSGRRGAVETLEDSLAVALGHAGAVVAHADMDHAVWLGRQPD